MTLEQLKDALQAALAWLQWHAKKQADPTITEPAPPLPVIPPPVKPRETPLIAPVTNVKPDYLSLMANAIAAYEGGPGDRNHLNNNPGNLRKWPGYPVEHGFAKFPDWATGLMALKTLLKNAAKGISPSYSPNMSLYQFFEKYAPSNDNNNPFVYASFVAKRMGVGTNWQIKNLL